MTKWPHPRDIPIEVLQPLVLEIAKEFGVNGRDAFCTREQNACVGSLKQRLGSDAGHMRVETLAAVVLNHGKMGRMRFSESKNTGAKSYIDRESLGNDEFYDRLNKPDWPMLSNECKRRAEFKCQMCNAVQKRGTPLEAHHRTYERMRTDEEIKDLICLCRRCHKLYHDKVKDMPLFSEQGEDFLGNEG